MSVAVQVPALTDDERSHYSWLLTGLLEGAGKLADRPDKKPLLRECLSEVRELSLELLARVA